MLKAAAKAVIACAAALALSACEPAFSRAPQGDAARGRDLAASAGCGSCHRIPGIRGAVGEAGPPLDGIGRRIYLAGMLRNSPEAMTRWIQHPQEVVPGNAMPDLGLSTEDASAIAAYLETLR